MPRKKAQSETEIEQPVSTNQSFSLNAPLRKSFSFQTLVILVIALVMGGIITMLYLQSRQVNQELKQLKEQQNTAPAVDETKQLLDEVSQILVLPQNETPTIATVSDISKLAGQPFFEAAAVGDKVIIYSTSKKAILYRPSEKKVINIAPLTVEAGQSSASTESADTNSTPAKK